MKKPAIPILLKEYQAVESCKGAKVAGRQSCHGDGDRAFLLATVL